VLGHLGGGAEDWYQLSAQAGDLLEFQTSTPGGGPSEFQNLLDPVLEVYDPAGHLLVSDDNSAADGRNALLRRAMPAAGAYRVRVRGGTTAGEYLLSVATPPNVQPILGPAVGVPGQTLSYAALFTDVDIRDAHTAVIHWGDGSSTPGSVSES